MELFFKKNIQKDLAGIEMKRRLITQAAQHILLNVIRC